MENNEIYATTYTEMLILKRENAELENLVQILQAENAHLKNISKISPKNCGCSHLSPKFDVL